MRKALHDRVIFYSLLIPTLSISLILILLFLTQAGMSLPVLGAQGLETYTSAVWRPVDDPARARYGLAPAIAGTVLTALIAISLGLLLTISLVLFVEELALKPLKKFFSVVMDLMAGIPTIIYGLWGLGFLSLFLKDSFMMPVYGLSFPYLDVPVLSMLLHPVSSPPSPAGVSIFTAGVLLAIMIVPFMFVIVQEAYKSIPFAYREAALSLGMTKYEYSKTMLSMIRHTILGALLLGFGRASAETAAVTLVVGNAMVLTTCIFSPAYTISSLIATQFAEARGFPYMESALFAGGLFLLILGMVINVLGVFVIWKYRVRF